MNVDAPVKPYQPWQEQYKRQLLAAHKRAGRHVTPENALLYIKLSEDVLRLLKMIDRLVTDKCDVMENMIYPPADECRGPLCSGCMDAAFYKAFKTLLKDSHEMNEKLMDEIISYRRAYPE